MKPRRNIVLATRNQGKLREMQELFRDLPLEVRSLNDYAGVRDVEETGKTFRENAELKASDYAKQTGHFCLADDSGLEIESLDGEPGVRSARFAGADTGYDLKNARVLEMMKASSNRTRSARFLCAMSIADSSGEVLHTVEGVCSGSIAETPRGENGFGYDPIFIPDGYDRTFGELGDDVKQRISHRAKAANQIVRYLLDFIAMRT